MAFHRALTLLDVFRYSPRAPAGCTVKETAMKKKIATALVIVFATLSLTVPALAKDPWVIAFGEEPFTLNPANKGALAAVSDYVEIHIFDALVDVTGPEMSLKPMLAERWENPNPNTWRFHIRRGVKFHNGDPLTAEDVKFTIDLGLANKGSTQNSYLGPTETVRVVDPYTVELTTKTPFPPLLANISRLHIVPRVYAKIGADAFSTKQPIGTGPYKFVEWQHGQRIVLEANPDYWAGAPAPKRLIFRFIPDPSTRAAELKAGGVDIITGPPIAQLKELAAGDTAIVTVPAVRVIAYPFNTLQKPLGDVRVRRALNLAVDRETIVKTLLQGYGKPTGQPFIPGWLGYDPEIKPFPYDPAQAKKLLADAGYASGFDLTWNISTGVFLADKEIAEAASAMLGQVGVRVRLVPTERAKIQKDLQAGTFDGMTAGQWGTSAESDVMAKWFFRPHIFTPELDAKLAPLVAAASNEVDRTKRGKIWTDLSRLAHDEALWLYIHYQDETIAKRRDIPWQYSNGRGSKGYIYYYIPAAR
jgi:peptide/nickel transport system substrate-binding protein